MKKPVKYRWICENLKCLDAGREVESAPGGGGCLVCERCDHMMRKEGLVRVVAHHFSATYDLPPIVVDGRAHQRRGGFPYIFAKTRADAVRFMRRQEPSATNLTLADHGAMLVAPEKLDK